MTAQQPLQWFPLQETSTELEAGECIYLRQAQFPIIGVVFQDPESDEAPWAARVLVNGTCNYAWRDTETEAKRYVEEKITETLKCFKEEMAVPTVHEDRSPMENILVFLLATIEAQEQILMVTEYHKLWVAICYNTHDGGIQDYTMKFDSEGNPYCPEAEDFSGQFHASFSIRGKTGDSPLMLNEA